jgi:hypothetical protein
VAPVAQNRSSQEQACSVKIQGSGEKLFNGKVFIFLPEQPRDLLPVFIDLTDVPIRVVLED